MTVAVERREQMLGEIERRRDELIALTQDLVRFPTLNPPGDGYLEICEYLAERLGSRGFAIEMMRAEGTPGDSDKYPRWNVVARKEGRRAGDFLHFNSHTDVVLAGQGWTVDPFGAELRALRPRRVAPVAFCFRLDPRRPRNPVPRLDAVACLSPRVDKVV